MRLKARARDAHKGDFGHVLIIAGSRGMAGAVCLCAEGALRSGAGLVTVGIPSSLYPIVAGKLTEAMTLPLPETSDGALAVGAARVVKAMEKKCTVLAIGPGLSTASRTQQFVRNVVRAWQRPAVIDADGLNACAGHLAVLKTRHADTVLTPHPGEMGRLLGITTDAVQKNRRALAKKFSGMYNNVTVLKGSGTVVTDARECYVNDTGNPGMAKGGCGDILTGMIAALIAQGYPAFDAAKIGVYMHGLAGDMAVRVQGETALCARDILHFLPAAFKTGE